jgi:transcriptional regulator with XRE-family HTH domain
MSGLKKQTTARERVAHNLRNCRLARGMTQETLAANAEITQTFLSQLESAKRNVSVDTVERLAQALEVDIVDLLAPLKIVE